MAACVTKDLNCHLCPLCLLMASSPVPGKMEKVICLKNIFSVSLFVVQQCQQAICSL